MSHLLQFGDLFRMNYTLRGEAPMVHIMLHSKALLSENSVFGPKSGFEVENA